MSILLLTLAEQGKGQNRDTLKVEGILSINMENRPKGFMNDKTGIMIIAKVKNRYVQGPQRYLQYR